MEALKNLFKGLKDDRVAYRETIAANEAAASSEVAIDGDTVRVRLPGKEQFVTFAASSFRPDELDSVWSLALEVPTSMLVEQQREHTERNDADTRVVMGGYGEDVNSHYGYTDAEIRAAKEVGQREFQKAVDARVNNLKVSPANY